MKRLGDIICTKFDLINTSADKKLSGNGENPSEYVYYMYSYTFCLYSVYTNTL